MAAALPEGSLPRGSVTPALAGSAPMGNFFVVIALFVYVGRAGSLWLHGLFSRCRERAAL